MDTVEVVRVCERPTAGLRCPFCHDPLGDDGRPACPDCGVSLHGDCGLILGGCTTLGCRRATTTRGQRGDRDAWAATPGRATCGAAGLAEELLYLLVALAALLSTCAAVGLWDRFMSRGDTLDVHLSLPCVAASAWLVSVLLRRATP